MNIWQRNLIYLLALVVFSGCSSAKEAREVSRVTLAQLTTYENLVDKKIRVEKTFYSQSMANLQESLKRGQETEDMIKVSRAVNDFDSYASNPKNDLKAKDLREFVVNLLEELRHSRTLYAEAKAKYNQDLLNSLAKLELQRDSLDKVQKGLEKLQIKTVDPDLVLEWFAVWQNFETNMGKKP